MSITADVVIPYNYEPRDYQLQAWRFLRGGGKRAALVWHRRAGKDLMLLNLTITKAVERVGVYWHVFPTARQGRKIVWDGVTKAGRPFLDYWPRQLIASRNESEMKIKTPDGSVWQVVGSDNYNEALVGGNPCGLVMSEYALQDPACWNFLRPILAENGGWAAFAFTPRGKNHGFDLAEIARKTPGWFYSRLGARDTGAVTLEAIEEERRAGMPDELIDQEFHVSFDAALVGAYYGKQLQKAGDEGRLDVEVPHDPELPVETWWDLGVDDETAIWFVQRARRQVSVIDYYSNRTQGLEHYVRELKARPYMYTRHIVPSDIKVKEWGTGKTRLEQMELALLQDGDPERPRNPNVRVLVATPMSVADGIAAVRRLLPRVWVSSKCSAGERSGLEALKQYQRKWDDARKTFLDEPLHNWCSHGADAFRYGAIMADDPVDFISSPIAQGAYDPLSGPPSLQDYRRSSSQQTGGDYDPFSQ